jgi:hypothetical protein
MKAEIADALREALNGSRQVEITFKHNAIQDILFLFGMLSPFNLRIEDAHTIILESAVESGEWEHDNNRTVVVTLLQNFDQSWFIDRMGRALENISAVPKKP